MTDPAHMVAVAKRLFAAIESGDVDTVRDLFAEDARIWHNVDGIEQTRDENLRTLAWVVENLADRRYGDVTCQPTPTGFVQQHVLRTRPVQTAMQSSFPPASLQWSMVIASRSRRIPRLGTRRSPRRAVEVPKIAARRRPLARTPSQLGQQLTSTRPDCILPPVLVNTSANTFMSLFPVQWARTTRNTFVPVFGAEVTSVRSGHQGRS